MDPDQGGNVMRRLIPTVLVILAAGAVAPTAFADSAHFIGTPSCTKSLSSGLTCKGKAAGLGNGPTFASLTAEEVKAEYVCENKGGNVAPGQPVVLQNVSGPTQEITPRNGQITFSPNIPVPPKPSAAVDCPNGNWKVKLTSLTYVNVVLTVEQPATGTVLTDKLGTIDP
jgi:hypothetical protein